jgi:hypothetical protein
MRQTGLKQWKSVGSLVKLSADHALEFSLAAVRLLEDSLGPLFQQERRCCRPEELSLPGPLMRALERHPPALCSS